MWTIEPISPPTAPGGRDLCTRHQAEWRCVGDHLEPTHQDLEDAVIRLGQACVRVATSWSSTSWSRVAVERPLCSRSPRSRPRPRIRRLTRSSGSTTTSTPSAWRAARHRVRRSPGCLPARGHRPPSRRMRGGAALSTARRRCGARGVADVLVSRWSHRLPYTCTPVALPAAESRVILRAEVRAGLVPTSVFKTDGSSRERRIGGFDSLALPPIYAVYGKRREPAPSSRTRAGCHLVGPSRPYSSRYGSIGVALHGRRTGPRGL